MATAHPSALPGEQARMPRQVESGELAIEQTSPTVNARDGEQTIALNSPIARLPVEVDVAIPVREFRVRNLLTISTGTVIETQWAHGEDMPIAAGEVQLAWSEFEVMDTQLAVRVTRLA